MTKKKVRLAFRAGPPPPGRLGEVVNAARSQDDAHAAHSQTTSPRDTLAQGLQGLVQDGHLGVELMHLLASLLLQVLDRFEAILGRSSARAELATEWVRIKAAEIIVEAGGAGSCGGRPSKY